MKIYSVNSRIRLSDTLYEELLKLVDLDYQERILRYRFWEDRQRSLFGCLLSRYAIIKNFGLRNDEIKITENEYGKPFVSECGKIYFNVSHSGDWVVCVINNSVVGIDVQEIESIELSIAERFFTKEENDYLLSLKVNDRLQGFYDIWSLKEAYIKALGIGFSMPLNKFSVVKSEDGFKVKETSDTEFYFKQYPIDKEYKLSVCSKKNNFCHTIESLTINDIRVVFQ
ncbi:4'-phosphopantetheinyl transferase [Kineothrix alysoides]|uniref:4'-phosphopantetheinyl transferase n=2 Tax=Kineothrix alysoides TaxID=1469948 RepID=A0A4V2QBT0_9FIRM|nr:4'-phosphopantetheinyl transferase [Kineothrix alysoides]